MPEKPKPKVNKDNIRYSEAFVKHAVEAAVDQNAATPPGARTRRINRIVKAFNDAEFSEDSADVQHDFRVSYREALMLEHIAQVHEAILEMLHVQEQTGETSRLAKLLFDTAMNHIRSSSFDETRKDSIVNSLRKSRILATATRTFDSEDTAITWVGEALKVERMDEKPWFKTPEMKGRSR